MTTDEQIADLLPVAAEAARRFGLGHCNVESVNHGYNSTFKVTSQTGSQFALRININSVRSLANTLAEVAWISQLAEQQEINVPQPVLTAEGQSVMRVPHRSTDRDLTVVMYSWLDGDDLGDEAGIEQLEALGATMARMHEQSVHFALPNGADLPVFSDVLWNTRNCLLGDESELTAEEQSLLRVAFAEVQQVMDAMFAHTAAQVIHADLHGWNVKWHDGQVAVFDFDDCGYGLPIQDLATALYYLDSDEQRDAMKRGYASVRPLPAHTEREMQALLLQRRILLSNYLYETTHPEHRAMAPEYFVKTLQRIEAFLQN